jgi:hypothetical protein
VVNGGKVYTVEGAALQRWIDQRRQEWKDLTFANDVHGLVSRDGVECVRDALTSETRGHILMSLRPFYCGHYR